MADDVAALDPNAEVTTPPPATPDVPELPKSELEDPFARAAKRTARGQIHRTPTPEIHNEEEYAALDEGAEYISPEGKRQRKSYTVKDESDYDRVPEGATYLDPEGNTKTKAKYEPVDSTANYLHQLATNKRERKRALERSYPGMVKEDTTGEFYVEEENGTRRRPKGFSEAPGTNFAAGAPQVIGSLIGEIAGGVGGSVIPGAGTAAGAIAGGGIGGMAGQTFNDAILGLAGVYDRSVGEQVGETALAGAFGAGGAAVGRAVASAPKALIDKAKNVLPGAARKFLGVNVDEGAGLERAIGMREKGAEAVPISSWAPESPMAINIAEVYDPAFRTQQPMRQAATKFYDKMTRGIANRMGIDLGPDLVTEPSAAVSSREAGELILAKRTEELAAADARLQEKLSAKASTRPNEGPNTVVEAAAEARQAAQGVINEGFRAIERDAASAARVSETGHGAGDLWQAVATRFQAIKRGITERGRVMYDTADELAGPHRPEMAEIPQLAQDFLREVPPDFASRQPAIVQRLQRLAGVPEYDAAGQQTGWLQEPYQPTFGELRNIRSMLRHDADWHTLSGDVQNGSYKFFANAVDRSLHNVDAVPGLRPAVEALDAADAFWRENTRVFNAQQVKAVMRGLEAGEPADAKKLFDVVMKEGHSDLSRRLMEMIGPQLAAGVRAADVQEMLTASRSLVPGAIDGMKFVREVLSRYQRDMLQTVHGEAMGNRLLEQAQRISALEGRLNIPVREGDRAMDIINRARTAADLAKEAAKRDPLKTFENEMKQVVTQHQRELKRLHANDPLKHIYDPTVGAEEAADHILGSADLMFAAASKWKSTSPEFEALRQVFVKRLFARGPDLKKSLKAVTPEMQALMFPGTTLKDMQTLAAEMETFTKSRAVGGFGQSLAAQAHVTHPESQLPKHARAIMMVPGLGRKILGSYYEWFYNLTNDLPKMKWLAKGLRSSDPAVQQQAREVMLALKQGGGATGAGLGELVHAFPRQPQPIEGEEAQPQKLVRDSAFDSSEFPPMAIPGRIPVNADRFAAAMESHEPSENIEDRRGDATPQQNIDEGFESLWRLLPQGSQGRSQALMFAAKQAMQRNEAKKKEARK